MNYSSLLVMAALKFKTERERKKVGNIHIREVCIHLSFLSSSLGQVQ